MREPVLLESLVGRVANLRMNRPDTRNSLDPELAEALGAAFARAAAAPDVRVVTLAGQGGAFCSGVDLKSAAAHVDDLQALRERLNALQSIVRQIAALPKPVIAIVDGAAAGFGADLALACDLRICSNRAFFEERFVGLGLMPDGGGTYHLPKIVGLARAMEQMLLGTRVDATTALSLGMVNRVVPTESLDEEVSRVAAQLATAAPRAVAAIKRALREPATNLEDALTREREGQLSLLSTEDFREGLRAFAEKRAPKFEGR